eukprot:2018510-Pleurochrysis_carterae.AAC.4
MFKAEAWRVAIGHRRAAAPIYARQCSTSDFWSLHSAARRFAAGYWDSELRTVGGQGSFSTRCSKEFQKCSSYHESNTKSKRLFHACSLEGQQHQQSTQTTLIVVQMRSIIVFRVERGPWLA